MKVLIAVMSMVASILPAGAEVRVMLACNGKVEIHGAGEPVSEPINASVTIEGNRINLSFMSAPCNVTAIEPNGIQFSCNSSNAVATTAEGYLNRLTGGLDLRLSKSPKDANGISTTTDYALSCKRASPLF